MSSPRLFEYNHLQLYGDKDALGMLREEFSKLEHLERPSPTKQPAQQYLSLNEQYN